jgi:hypothetical protein
VRLTVTFLRLSGKTSQNLRFCWSFDWTGVHQASMLDMVGKQLCAFMKRLHKFTLAWVTLALSAFASGHAADITLPAIFTINPVVAATNPGAWTATTVGGTVNAVNSGGGFEPLCFKWRWQAAGTAADRLILSEADMTGWDTYNDGFFNGSKVRIYRASNNHLTKVREDTIAAHRIKRWMGVEGVGTINAGITACQFTLPGWFSPVQRYYFSVVAVDHNGNQSAISNVVSALRNTVTGGQVTNQMHTFAAPASPTETNRPAAPANLSLSLHEATGIFTLTWTGVGDSDLEGYQVLMSYWPPEEIGGLEMELVGRATNDWSHVRRGDLIYVDRTRTEWDPRALISPRLYGDYASGMPNFWPWDIAHLDDRRRQHLVPHPEPVPAEFTASQRGKTCLHVSTTIPGDEVVLGQYNHAGTNQTWYPVLEVGATYVVEAWMRQEGITNDTVTFRLGGDYRYLNLNDPEDVFIPEIDFHVTGQWVKHTATFTIPGVYDEEGVGTTELQFVGPGELWLDNFRVYKQGTEYMDWPEVDYDALEDTQLGALRTHQFIKSSWSYTMEELTNPAGVAGGRGRETGHDHTLPHLLGILERAQINPWLQIETSQNESEWLGLVEYLAAPYNPAEDTPASKPWAFKRFDQGHPTPWSDSFDTIYFEISNEMWNMLGDFAPWNVNGVTMPDSANGGTHDSPAVQGMLQEYVNSIMKSSPWWSRLQGKWQVVIGGWHGNTDEDAWGFAAVKKCPDIKHVT